MTFVLSPTPLLFARISFDFANCFCSSTSESTFTAYPTYSGGFRRFINAIWFWCSLYVSLANSTCEYESTLLADSRSTFRKMADASGDNWADLASTPPSTFAPLSCVRWKFPASAADNDWTSVGVNKQQCQHHKLLCYNNNNNNNNNNFNFFELLTLGIFTTGKNNNNNNNNRQWSLQLKADQLRTSKTMDKISVA